MLHQASEQIPSQPDLRGRYLRKCEGRESPATPVTRVHSSGIARTWGRAPESRDRPDTSMVIRSTEFSSGQSLLPLESPGKLQTSPFCVSNLFGCEIEANHAFRREMTLQSSRLIAPSLSRSANSGYSRTCRLPSSRIDPGSPLAMSACLMPWRLRRATVDDHTVTARTRILAAASALAALCALSDSTVLARGTAYAPSVQRYPAVSAQAYPMVSAQASPQTGMSCVCPFPQGYCPLPQGYCPPPSTCCDTALPLGVPTPYTPRPLGAPCASPQSMASPQGNAVFPGYPRPFAPANPH